MDVEEQQSESKLKPYVPGLNTVDISPAKDGGVVKEILQEGTGDDLPGQGNECEVHYVGTLLDGTKFDSSRDRKSPFKFSLGQGSVIKAWDIGVATMKKGEKCVLICKPEYAYGAAGSPPKIPPNATLVFEVELLCWHGEDLSENKDKGIIRYKISEGEGYGTPADGTVVDVHLVGTHEGRTFEDREVTFPIGEGAEFGICSGLERALESFKKKEKSRIELKAKYAFGPNGNEELGVPQDADVVYVVEMKNFEKLKENWDMDCAEKLEQSRFFKEKGTSYFKKNKFEVAIRMYKKVVDLLQYDHEFVKDEDKIPRAELMLQARLNIAMCHLKLGENIEARDACSTVLELDPNNEKGHFRRGTALLNLCEPELAKSDFEAILKIDPSNKAAINQVRVCQLKIKEQLSKEKQIYANMFEKFAKIDRQKEEEERQKLPDVMKTLGEWGQEDRETEMGDFERENPNILLLNKDGQFKGM